MAIFLIDLPPNEMERRLSDALGVYVDAMRYPRGSGEPARRDVAGAHPATRLAGGGRHRQSATYARGDTEGATSDELKTKSAVGGRTERRAVARRGLRLSGRTRAVVAAAGGPGLAARRCGRLRRSPELMTSYFELTELHIHPRAQGRGLGEALARRLLAGRSEQQCSALDAGNQRRVQPRVAVVPAAGLRRRHPRLPFRRRSARVRDPGPGASPLELVELRSRIWHDDLVRASSPRTTRIRWWRSA